MEIQPMIIGLIAVNSLILAALLYVFARNYRHIKTKYSIGLIIFSFLFLADNILALLMNVSYWPAYSDSVVTLVLARRIIEFIGLSSLLYITWR